MINLSCSLADFTGTVVGDQKVCTSGGYKLMINFSKLFENTNNGTKNRNRNLLPPNFPDF